MLVNDIDIKIFNAKQLTVDIQTSTFENSSEWIKGALSPFFDKNTIGFKTIKVELYFEGESRDEILNNISNLLSKLKGIVILKLDGYAKNYECILNGNETTKTVSGRAYKKTLTFIGYEFGNEIIETMNLTTSKTITVQGNTETPAIVEITPTSDLIDITLNGFGEDSITIKNLTANKKVILDGEAGLVTVDGANKYLDTDFWEFPTLQPGTNTITCSRSTATITIKYKPRWI